MEQILLEYDRISFWFKYPWPHEIFSFFEGDKIEMKKVDNIQKDMIRLICGGNYYSTSKPTLFSQRNSMLEILFSGYYKLTKSEDGS